MTMTQWWMSTDDGRLLALRKGPLSRGEVYELIDGERTYQDRLIKPDPGRTNTAGIHSVGEFLVMMGTYYRRALDAWTDNPGDVKALDNLRKVAAIAITCMEQNGGVARVVDGKVWLS